MVKFGTVLAGRRTAPTLFLLLATACSSGFFYRHADWLLMGYLDDYLALDDAQQREAERRIERLMSWHRYRELPRYAAYLRALLAALERPMTAAQVEDHFAQLQGFWASAMEAALPELQAQLQGLSPRQCEHLLRRLEERQQKMQRRYRDRSEAARAERMEKRLRRWLGPLRADQRRQLRDWASRQQDPYPPPGEERRWLQAAAAALEQRSEPALLESQLRQLLLQPESLWEPDLGKRWQHNRRQTAALYAKLHAGLDKSQRRHLRRRLEGWLSEVEALIGDD